MNAVERSRDVSLQNASDLSAGPAFCSAPIDVGAGLGLAAHPGQRDGVERAVERAVRASVESVAADCGHFERFEPMSALSDRVMPAAHVASAR